MALKILTSCAIVFAFATISAPSNAQERRVTFREASVTVQLLECPPKEEGLIECREQAKVRGDIANAIRWDDYPWRARIDQRGGIVRFRLLADTKDISRAGACTIVISSGHDDIDAETCKLLKRRVRFEAQSVNVMRTGVDGRVIYIPSWETTDREPPSPIIHIGYLFGDASDRPRCWTKKVQPEGVGFRIYLELEQPNFNTGSEPAPQVRLEKLPDGKSGSSFFLAPGDGVGILGTPHNACAMKIVEKDGRPAVKQHATFSWH